MLLFSFLAIRVGGVQLQSGNLLVVIGHMSFHGLNDAQENGLFLDLGTCVPGVYHHLWVVALGATLANTLILQFGNDKVAY